MRNVWIGPFAAALLAGCVSSGTKVTAEQAAAFKPGVTTEAQIVAQLGEPTSTITHADGSVSISYVHSDAHANAASYIPVVGLLAGGMKGTSNSVNFDINKDGLLESTSSSSSNQDISTGLANQR